MDHKNRLSGFSTDYFMSKILRRVVVFLYFLSCECETDTLTLD